MKNLFARFARLFVRSSVVTPLAPLLVALLIPDGPLPEQLALGCLTRSPLPKADLNLGCVANDDRNRRDADSDDYWRTSQAKTRKWFQYCDRRQYEVQCTGLRHSWDHAVWLVEAGARYGGRFVAAKHASECTSMPCIKQFVAALA